MGDLDVRSSDRVRRRRHVVAVPRARNARSGAISRAGAGWRGQRLAPARNVATM